MKNYVTGFLFSKDATSIVLIKKINPLWQRGLFNGVGGKVELNECPNAAMTREFEEETGVIIPQNQWTLYANINRPEQYNVNVYFAHSNLAFDVQSVEQETVHVISMAQLPDNIIPNLKWLIPLALDQQANFSSPVSIQEIATKRIHA